MAKWSKPLDEFFEEFEQDLSDEVKAIFVDAAQFLIDVTPVRTGRLRGGYQAGLNRSPAFARPPDDKSGAVTFALINGVIQQFKLTDTLFITNYTPYGPYVNDGTSNMAGQFMIERTVNYVQAR